MSQNPLTAIYNRRFRNVLDSRADNNRKNAWEALFSKVLGKYVSPDMSVLDLGSGPGYFCNQVSASRVTAVDLDPNNAQFLKKGIEFHATPAQNLELLDDDTFDLAFSSNLFEHLGSSQILSETLNELHRVLKKDDRAKLLVLMPNIRYTKWDFFNFIDHNLPLNEISLQEAFELSNFEVLKSYKKFFPYSAKDSRLTIPVWLIKLYLCIPPLGRPIAKQMFFIVKPINHKK